MHRKNAKLDRRRNRVCAAAALVAGGLLFTLASLNQPALSVPPNASILTAAATAFQGSSREAAANTIGPERTDNNCASCHALEHEAWMKTRHFATFKDRHRSPEAREILKNLDQKKGMKGSDMCLNCHYTSIVRGDDVSPEWGVSCESCHAPGQPWNNIHNKVGGDPAAATLQWGTGKSESPEQRAKRLGAAQSHGMIHSQMIYEIARNCFSCHTVPDETLVNKGKHKAGSDFDLVAWSQGEIRHNFVSSEGAPDSPTNRPATAAERRRLYVVGAMVDLEISLRNLSRVTESGGEFHLAMIERVNRARAKVSAIVNASPFASIKAAVALVPELVDASTPISPDLVDKIGEAAKSFANGSDGSELGAIDGLIPTAVKGKVYER